MRSLHLVERPKLISERNIAFREYLGPQSGSGQGGAGVLLVTALWMFLFPQLRRIRSLDERPAAGQAAGADVRRPP